MRFYCACFDSRHLARGLALHESLLAQAGGFELVVLCLDEAVESHLRHQALPQVRLLTVAELVRQHPPLAAARSDRTAREFHATCPSWLMQHLLPRIGPGALLTYLDANLYFFGSPEPLYKEIGLASVAITPNRFPPALAHLERRGKFNAGWLSLRHDATGLACAADWAVKCAAWCFTIEEPDRYAEQKYLDAWPAQFPGTVIISHPGVNVAPWNVAEAVISLSPQGLLIDQHPLISYQFHGLHHLAEGLYDSGLHRYGTTPSAVLRAHVYQPYLRGLDGTVARPDIVPPEQADDPRCGGAIAQLAAQLQTASREVAACQLAVEQNQAATRRALEESRVTLTGTLLHLKEVEQDRAEQRLALLKLNQDLKQACFDLERRVTQLRNLQADMEAQGAGKDAQIASLNEELAKRAVTATQMEQADVQTIMEPFSRSIRRLVVARFHPRLLPEILWLSLYGTDVVVLGSPPEYVALTRSPIRFLAEPLLEWLGQIDSLFNERAYRLANPDVSAAINQGSLVSGWDHYLRFGRLEGRTPGGADYCSGLADFDAIAFDGSDAGSISPFLAGRLQPYHQLFISGFTPPTDWLPPGDARSYILGHTLHCQRPPTTWLGPLAPANGLTLNLPAVSTEDIYPEKPAQRADWPRISIVTVSHNQAARLEETIRSVLDQNYPNLEYIVIDGGSTDGSSEIIRKYSQQLVWRVNETISGPAQALNRGFSRATGRILTWLNSGDRLAPGSLFTVGQNFLLHATDVLAGRCARDQDSATGSLHIHRNHLPLDRIQPLPLDELLEPNQGWLPGRFFQQPEVFFTRDIFERTGGGLREDLRSGMTYDLWVRMAKAGARLFALPEILAISREQPPATGSDDPAPELRSVNAAHRKSLSPDAPSPPA